MRNLAQGRGIPLATRNPLGFRDRRDTVAKSIDQRFQRRSLFDFAIRVIRAGIHDSAVDRMHVQVVKARKDCLAAEINKLGGFTGLLLNGRGVANRRNPAIDDRDRLHPVIGGLDMPVRQDQIGRRRRARVL